MHFSLFFVTILLVTASKGSKEIVSPNLENTASYNITNLWNGTEDTLSNATDKGGNQVTVKLQGMLPDRMVHCHKNKAVLFRYFDQISKMQILLDFDNFVRIEIDAPFYNDPPPPNGKPGEPYDRV